MAMITIQAPDSDEKLKKLCRFLEELGVSYHKAEGAPVEEKDLSVGKWARVADELASAAYMSDGLGGQTRAAIRELRESFEVPDPAEMPDS